MSNTVPPLVKKNARKGLDAHKADPSLEDVSGLGIAHALARGTVTDEQAGKMFRFFTRHDSAHRQELRVHRTALTSPVVRSCMLHGGEAGSRWVKKLHKALVKAGAVEEDPLVDLFGLDPDKVYARFQVGAWRYEYGLTPRTAARFVQHYTTATGNQLDLGRAFGDAAKTIGNLIYRMHTTPSPFEQARKAAKVDATSLRKAAQQDMKKYAQAETLRGLPGNS